ncbi:MAG TPA: hypothetical protein VF690_10415 [Hymenobacter sp.]|jgi:hypothetical protein
MRFLVVFFLLLLVSPQLVRGQSYQPTIEVISCPVKFDARLVVKYGYLVVPENRRRPLGRKVKIPFLFVRKPEQDARRHVSLYSTGGPGYSTTANADSIGYRSGLVKYGGSILFDQRGTKRAQPCLDCPEVGEAVKRSYRTGLNQDSLVLLAATQCRKNFTSQGVDLSAYTTLESAEDINDLRLALHLDSLNLMGVQRLEQAGVLAAVTAVGGGTTHYETVRYNAREQVLYYTTDVAPQKLPSQAKYRQQLDLLLQLAEINGRVNAALPAPA